MDTERQVTRTRILLPRRRSHLLSRQRLLDLLFDLLDNKFTILIAPAGYGKTSLLIDFANHIELPVCWYAVDKLDHQLVRFVAHFIASLNLKFPKFGRSSTSALDNATQGKLNLDHLVATIVNDVYENISEYFVIMLDDYHLVDSSLQIGRFISRFIQGVDENCHLILSSRTLLTLPDLPLMVSRSLVGGLSSEELAFQADEIQALFIQNNQSSISNDSARKLILETEGWITGLLLTTQIKGKDIINRAQITRASGIGLNEYFTQLLDQEPEPLQEFMLRTSLLEEFDAKLCEEIIGKALSISHANWEEFIEDLLRHNLFTLPVDEEGVWLRYHHLFLDFLQNNMLRKCPEEAAKIQQHLAQGYIQRGEWEKAYALYHSLGNTNAIADLVEHAGPSLTVSGRLDTLSEWLDALPTYLIEKRPGLVSLQGNVAVMAGDTKLALTFFNQSIKAMKLPDDQKILAQAFVRRSLSYRLIGNYSDSIVDAKEAIKLTENDLSLRSVQSEALRSIGVNLYQLGRLDEALKWLTRSLETYQSIKYKQNEAVLLLELGLVYQTLGDFPKAEMMYTDALQYWQSTSNSVWLANLMNNLGVLQHLNGDYESAVSSLEKALKHSKICGYRRLEAYALTGIGDLYRELEATKEALIAYRQASHVAQEIEEGFLLIYLKLVNASIAQTEGELPQANKLIKSAQKLALAGEAPFENHLCNLEWGALKIWEEKPDEAMPYLEKACTFFSKEGHRIQTEKAHFYLTIAYYKAGDQEKVSEHLMQVIAYFAGSHKPNSLIITGWQFKGHLEAMKDVDHIGPQISELLQQISRFEKRIPKLRRRLRRRASSIPFAPPKLFIKTFGRMQVKLNDRVISKSDWQTQSARNLFFLLLAHPEGLTKEEIGLFFWPDASPSELKFRFKNGVYRLRHAVGRDTVILEENYYRFNHSLDYEYDVEIFLKEIALAKRASNMSEKIKHFQAALKLYKGPFLSEVEETWVLSAQEHLAQNNQAILLRVADLYLKNEQYQLALDYCQQAIVVDPCLEAAHRLAIRIHAAMGNRAAVARQYNQCVRKS